MASSSSAIDNSDYDVFLSFRGTDTRKNFISHLKDALDRAKIKAFIDENLRRGEEITPALFKIIEGAKISIIVFSSDYASSTFCLEELVKILDCKDSKAQRVLPIFYNVDPGDVEGQKGSYRESFNKYESEFKEKKRCREEEKSQEDIKKMEKWKSALSRTAKLSGWHIDHNSNENETIRMIIGEILKLLDLSLTCQSKGAELISIPLAGLSSATTNVEKIWNCLMNDETSRIGVYGMGGVGKTTIITHIYNRLIRDTDSYAHIYWVTVSKALSIYKLQGDIAKVINLDFDKETDERKRAAMLWEALSKKRKFVLILDDMWESFEVEEVGIPISIDVGKLLLTTRMHGVCKTMNCGRMVKVDPLSVQEAWDLFMKESGYQIDDNPELRNIAERVAKQCVGLPLAIVTVARSTRKFVEMYEWRNILRELEKPSEGQNYEMEEKVFKPLKVSYDRLRNDKYRQCLLYCSLYPEDYMISRNALIEYWIGEGLVEKQDSRRAKFDKGNSIINELIDASLLEHHQKDHVKMHDVVRDMALTITRETSMVKAGLQLKVFPTEWSDTLERISIMENRKLKGCCLDLAPNCPKLRTLLMQANENLKDLPDCFFANMQNLTVLDMGYLWSLKILPDSIAKMENLRVLILWRCWHLEFIPSVAGLKNLLHLDLSETSLREIPNGLEKLVNLEVLNLSSNEYLKGLIPSAVLEKLSHLQSLRLEETYAEVEPNALISLEKLETLKVNFYEFDKFKSYLESAHWQRLEERHIFKNPKGNNNFEYTDPVRYKKAMCFFNIKEEETDIVIPDDIHYLRFLNCYTPIDGILSNGIFGSLQKLLIVECDIPYLITVAHAIALLRNIKILEIVACRGMKEIIATEGEPLDDESKANYPTIVLPNLKTLIFYDMCDLRSIYRGTMACPSLETINISCCGMLERLPFCMQKGESTRMMLPSLKQIEVVGESTWWESLQFDHPEAKTVFTPLVVESDIDSLIDF